MRFLFILVVIAIFALLILSFRRKSGSGGRNPVVVRDADKPQPRTVMQFDASPDSPVQFGYKTQWLAIRTTDTGAVLHALRLQNIRAANWTTGLQGAYDDYCFVSPPLEGWTLVVDGRMPDLSAKGAPGPLSVIAELSARFGEACYFGTHRVVEYQAWGKAVDGRLVRAYAYVGESGEVVVDRGELTAEERAHNLIFTGLDAAEPNLPDEEDVLRIAALWSVDTKLDRSGSSPGTGFAADSLRK